MFKKRSFIVFFAVVLLMVFVVGPVSASSLDEILKRGKIRIGVLPTCPPFSQYDDAGKMCGFDVDLSNKLADDLGVELELVDTEPNNRVPYLKTGKVDLIVGTFSRTIAREKEVDFSVPYVIAGPVVVVSKDNETVKGIEDLANKNVATIPGIVADIWAKKLQPEANFKEYKVEPDQLLALRQGKVDALVQDVTIASTYVNQYPEELKIVGKPFYRDYICIGIQQGSTELKNWVDWAIFQYHNLGEISKIWDEWFTYEEPEMNYSPFF